MRGTTHSIAARELHDIVARHFERLGELGVVSGDLKLSVPEGVIKGVEFLAAFCAVLPPAPVARNTYDEVQSCLDTIIHFLELVGYTIKNVDERHENRHLHHILSQAQKWCRAAAVLNAETEVDGVWELIDPVKPDNLASIGAGVFEAKWWKPVPWMDIEILRRTEGVIIQDEIVNPEKLPGGVAVRFVVAPAHLRGLERGA